MPFKSILGVRQVGFLNVSQLSLRIAVPVLAYDNLGVGHPNCGGEPSQFREWASSVLNVGPLNFPIGRQNPSEIIPWLRLFSCHRTLDPTFAGRTPDFLPRKVNRVFHVTNTKEF